MPPQEPHRPRTEPTRMPGKMSRDRAELDRLLDEVVLGHVGLVVDAGPVVVPTAVVRDGDRLLVHGSTGSGWMRHLAAGAEACVTVTALDGVVVARSAFESSFRYRSAVVFGRFAVVEGGDEERALDRLVDRLVPGRRSEVRPSTARELAATLVLAMPLDTWSLRVSAGWPEDEPEDVAGEAWAGVVPVRTTYGAPVPAPDLREGVPVPASVQRLVAGSGQAS